MLKALELNGFKSFADRTRFEFPEGITAVVGPNGSGKSNVVDAIKWVLGSQSAKAMRGKEMTDVIFSGASGRGQTNAAEVTLAFDNSAGMLDCDAEEVQITRRVYRSGEGEYLINRQPCRLRDIREVFAGTGVSTGAYSIIEQGKVDALLQSSPKERRLIFEEAAGVSRFKLKRQEAARRLERVDQNLLRLKDIVEELDSRLRSVRSQAGRARKFKEESDRLKQLRTEVALADWREITATLRVQEKQAAELTVEKQRLQEQVATCDAQLAAAEEAAEAMQRQVQEANSKAAAVREQIAQAESTRRSQLARSDELRQESQRLQNQLLTMTSRAGSAQQLVAETDAELMTAQQQFDEFNQSVHTKQAELDLVVQALQECRTKLADSRKRHTATISEASQLETMLHSLETQRTTATALIERASEQAKHAESVKNQLVSQVEAAQHELRGVEDEYQQSQQRLSAAEEKLRDDRQQLAQAQREKADLQERLTGAQARATVLEELERRLDGLSGGAKEVLRLSREQPSGPFGKVRGLVADLLHVDADTATLVETALGDLANSLVVEQIDPALLTMSENEWAGRTSFLRLDVPVAASAVDRIDLSGEPGVVGRADEFVETAGDLTTLPRRLLGRYWFVDNLQTAVRLASGVGRGLSYVTVVGEVVRADGTLTVGPRQATSGLLSRRSELRVLVDEIADLEQRNLQLEARNSQLAEAIETNDAEQQQLNERHQSVAHRFSESKLKTASLQQRDDEADRQWRLASEELTQAKKQANSIAASGSCSEKITQCEQQITELETLIDHRTMQCNQLEGQVDKLGREVTDHRVALARCEQRRDGLQRQTQQQLHDHEEHDHALQETRDREAESREQGSLLEQSVLTLSSELAELYHTKESLVAQLDQQSEHHESRRQQRTSVLRQVDKMREQLLDVQGRLQQVELSLQQLNHQRSDLSTRMKDDYAIELAVLAAESGEQKANHDRKGPEESDGSSEDNNRDAIHRRGEIDNEIARLKQKLQGIGPVNLEALSELEAVEDRHTTLSEQYEDLRSAKTRLQTLVSQINVESRQIFVETLDVIRGHFQELYGSLFGGGEADIILESGERKAESGEAQLATSGSSGDPLECGIEIVARPPGKQLRNISLLSGGERTMTCVALLLAIFRSRPSPFCVLDEVDAALDEANIDRFVEVLKEFMSTTQFIVVTHSKRTMSCADTMYGVTMQESGVSKRVSVRFEDVSADGNIRQAA
ncbi:MAG: chromosome segregation protein SMC [Planctomycetes bacterium]|nr:chromosome segregation protein SMC [Planctomycetota bacterium]